MIREVTIAPGVRYVLRPDGEIEKEVWASGTESATVCTPMVVRDLADQLHALANEAQYGPDPALVGELARDLHDAGIGSINTDPADIARYLARKYTRREAGS